MPYRVKVSGHRRRRPVSPRMQEILDRMGVKPEVSVGSHERAYTPRRRPKKKDEDDPKEDE